MAQGNMGMWDKIVSNCRHFDGDMRNEWREPTLTDTNLIAGQRDVLQGRMTGISKRSSAVTFRSEPAWKRTRRN